MSLYISERHSQTLCPIFLNQNIPKSILVREWIDLHQRFWRRSKNSQSCIIRCENSGLCLEVFNLIIFYLFIYLLFSHNKDYTSITLYKDVARGPQKTTRLVRGGPLVTIILSNRTITTHNNGQYTPARFFKQYINQRSKLSNLYGNFRKQTTLLGQTRYASRRSCKGWSTL